MGIVDYPRIAATAKAHFFNNEKISEINKEAMKRFLNAYSVSPAREAIFLAQIESVLIRAPNFEKTMHERDEINKLFKDLKTSISSSTFETRKNVARKFARWLNNNITPDGFSDIKGDKKNNKRNLEPKDMVTWEDGLEMCKYANSIQAKAALLTQLDCGFRPSEFIDLNYSDVSIDGDMVIFNVKAGKTGARSVWMRRAVPDFLLWYDNHPLKQKDSPLWLIENIQRSRKKVRAKANDRYEYPTLFKRFVNMRNKAGIDKPVDFYNLRHSSCVLDKIDNVPIDLAAQRHGHSIDFFVNTYGRLDLKGVLNRARSHYGVTEEKKSFIQNQICIRCKAINTPEADFCRSCGVPLTTEQAAKIFNERKELASKVEKLEKLMDFISKNPNIFNEEALKTLSKSKK